MVCAANLTNLVLTRIVLRARDLETMRALGATESALVRMQTAEGGSLVGVGLALGLLIAALMTSAMANRLPNSLLALGVPSITLRSIAFATLLAFALCLLIWIAASVFGKSSPERHRSSVALSKFPRMRATRAVLISTQCALAMALCVGASTFVRSYLAMFGRDAGYDPSAIAISLSVPPSLQEHRSTDLLNRTIAALRQLPGVLEVGATGSSVIASGMQLRGIRVAGEEMTARSATVSEDFFESAGMTLLAGRPLTSTDRRWSGVVVNKRFVAEHLAGRGPLGELVGYGQRFAPIVGVVEDVVDSSLDGPVLPVVYSTLDAVEVGVTIMVKAMPSGPTPQELAATVGQSGDGFVVQQADFLGDRLGNSVRDKAFASLVAAAFSVAAACVAVVGLLGVVGFVAAQRRKELAVRIVLGASQRHLQLVVSVETVVSALLGCAVGVVIGRWATLFAGNLIYGVEPGSWLTASVGGGAITLIIAAATALHSRKVTRIQPVESLRTI
ncbi:MAG: hypothetical protein AMXMBFR57_32410 [Acidimicrobiia bacterium]